MSEADEVKRPKGSTSTKKSPDIGLSDTSLKQESLYLNRALLHYFRGRVSCRISWSENPTGE